MFFTSGGEMKIRSISSFAALAIAGLMLAATLAHAEERAIRSRVAPVYPEIAKRMRIGGAVKVEATVDAEGRVIDVKTVNGNRMLSPAAEDAVRKWKFVAGTGTSTVDVEVNFAMGN